MKTQQIYHPTFTSQLFRPFLFVVLLACAVVPVRFASAQYRAGLQGTVTDDGLPNGSTLNGNWSIVTAPGKVTFADSHSPTPRRVVLPRKSSSKECSLINRRTDG